MRRVAPIVFLALALPVALGGAAAAQDPNCVPRNNVTAILDDSGSLGGSSPSNDPDRLRVDAMSLFIDKNVGKTLAAVEFGYSATTIFGPTRITPSNAAGLKSRIGGATAADNGGTNFNAAFTQAAAASPNATARMFFSDGEHTEGTYGNGHRGGPPTHSIGLKLPSSAAESLMRQIASETDGIFQLVAFPGDVAPAVNEVSAALNCYPPPVETTIPLPAPGRSAKLPSSPQIQPGQRAQQVDIFGDELFFYMLFGMLVFDPYGDWVELIEPLQVASSSQAGAAARRTCRVRHVLIRKRGSTRKKRRSPARVRCSAGRNFVSISIRPRSSRRSLRSVVGRQLRGTVRRRSNASPSSGRDQITTQYTNPTVQ